jgi:hypothetical protein
MRILGWGVAVVLVGSSSCSSYSGPCTISASSYDQSCTVDTDCTEVTSTDYCSTDNCLCGGSAINVAALAQFNADTSKTPLSMRAGACSCPAGFGPCCRSGMCTMTCFSTADALPACVDAGGTCEPGTCGRAGPPDACAFSDEVCCL